MNNRVFLYFIFALAIQPTLTSAQVNSGSNGSDGALSPTSNININMADHPTGIYQYTSVNIPNGVTITFTPNSNNSPVTWLVQGDCTVAGTVNLNGAFASGTSGAIGGPGGFAGGNWISAGSTATPGQGPGGGILAPYPTGNGSYGTGPNPYGSPYLIPLIGGSGGSSCNGNGGGGGGGAILIAASGNITISGSILAEGGATGDASNGSGGGVRLVANAVTCTSTGRINAYITQGVGNSGRIRIDALNTPITGNLSGVVTQGFQPIILPAFGQGIVLQIMSIAGAAVTNTPTGQVANPDIVIPAQQTNPIPVVVACSNVPLNSEISVVINPVNGSALQFTGANNAGTLASSTATINVNMPRGGGIIYATTVTGLASSNSVRGSTVNDIAQTGWTSAGERFVSMRITSPLGGKQQIAYITESGKRYALPNP